MGLKGQAKRKYQNAKKLSKVFPIIQLHSENKIPMGSEWQKIDDEEKAQDITNRTIQKLKDGENINYGMVMDMRKYITIDLDHIYDEETYPKFQEFSENFDLDTLKTKTASNGYHFTFKVSDYMMKRWDETRRKTLQSQNIYGWIDTRHGGQIVGPGCTVQNDDKYKEGGEKYEFRNNEYELLIYKEPNEISNELVDFLIYGIENRTKKTTNNKPKVKKMSEKQESKEPKEQIELSKKEKRRRQLIKKVVENDKLSEQEVEYIKQILDLIDRDTLREYDDALCLCFSLGSLGDRFYEICDNLMKKADENLQKGEKKKYDKEWVKDAFNRNKERFLQEPENGNYLTIDYAIREAAYTDIPKYNKIVRKLMKETDNHLQLEEEIDIDAELKKTIYPTVKENDKAIELKTYEAKYVEEYPIDDYNIMVMRSRMGSGKTTAMKKALDSYKPDSVLFLSSRIIYSYNMGQEFKDYGFFNYKKVDDFNNVDKLFSSLESIHKVNDENEYDIIILDELETLLNNLSSSTIADKEFEIKETFYNLLLNCDKVICNDAFLSDRSINFLRCLRKDRGEETKVYISINMRKPEQRQALIIKDKEKFENQLLKDLREGKKILFHCSSKENLRRICNYVEGLGYKVLAYHGDMDDNIKLNTGTDVNKEWAKYDMVAYTPSITVGVNFTKAQYFDKKYFMGYNSCLVRDSIQALDRCRETKTNELVIHFLNDRNSKQKFLNSRDFRIRQRFYYEGKEIDRLRKLYKMEIRGNYLSSNDWYGYVKLYNEKERRQTDACYSQVFIYYLQQLNYSITYDDITLKDEEKKDMEKLECDTEKDYDEIKTVISNVELNELHKKVMKSKATEEDRDRITKELMLRRFYYGKNFNEKVDDEKLKAIWKYWSKSREQTKLKRLHDELRGTIENRLTEELEKDTSRLTPIKSYPKIKEMYNVLGIKHSADDEKTFTTEQLEQKQEQLKPIINKLFKNFNIQDKNKNKEFKQNEGIKLKNDINRILNVWTGSSLKIDRRTTVRKDGENVKVTYYKLHNLVGIDKDILKNE